MARPVLDWANGYSQGMETYTAKHGGRSLKVYGVVTPNGTDWRWRVEGTDHRGNGLASADAAKLAAELAAGAQ